MSSSSNSDNRLPGHLLVIFGVLLIFSGVIAGCSLCYNMSSNYPGAGASFLVTGFPPGFWGTIAGTLIIPALLFVAGIACLGFGRSYLESHSPSMTEGEKASIKAFHQLPQAQQERMEKAEEQKNKESWDRLTKRPRI